MTPFTDHGASPTLTEHERSGPPILGDVHSFPSYAEQARSLVDAGAMATLSTLTNDTFPFTSMAPISVDGDASPIICVSELAEHTRNLRRSGRASVFVAAPSVEGADPLAEPRATYVGTFAPFDPDEPTIERHLEAHPHTQGYVRFADFGWWRMEVQHLRYVGGFGVMGWAGAEDLAAARPDPIIGAAPPMIDHLNHDHPEACTLIARHLGRAETTESATVTELDRYGVTFAATGQFDEHRFATVRVAFPSPLDAAEQVRAATVELVRRARAVTTGSSPSERPEHS